MRKITTLLSALALTGAVFTAQAQDIYISGSFNNFNPDNQDEWKLTQDLDEDLTEVDSDPVDPSQVPYTGYFEAVSADSNGQISFNFVTSEGKYLVPAQSKTLGSDDNVSNYGGAFEFEGTYIEAESGSNLWIIPDWVEGELSVSVDLNSKTITIKYVLDLPEVWYIRGAFNDYNPNYLAKWALNPLTEDEEGEPLNGVYAGTFQVPADELSFNLLSDLGVIWIPEMLKETAITFTDGSYSDGMEYWYMDGDELIYWVDKSWEGGYIYVSVDSNTGNMTVKDVTAEMTETPEQPEPGNYEMYVSGSFNQYNPTSTEGDNDPSDWQLVQGDGEDDPEYVYTKYIEIPFGEFSFNFLYGDSYLVPADQSGEAASTENVEVPAGETELSFIISDEKSEIYWVNEAWLGGEIYVKVNLEEKKVTFYIEEAGSDVPQNWYLLGTFNNFQQDDDYVLYPVTTDDGANIVYQGTFNIPEGEFKFNVLGNNFGDYSEVFVPLVMVDDEPSVDDVEVEFTNKEFVGQIYSAYDDEPTSEFYWTCPNWLGGEVNIFIDAQEGTITIENVDGTVGVGSINKVEDADAIYNLQGVKVDANKLSKGIYIVNGKKVLVP